MTAWDSLKLLPCLSQRTEKCWEKFKIERQPFKASGRGSKANEETIWGKIYKH